MPRGDARSAMSMARWPHAHASVRANAFPLVPRRGDRIAPILAESPRRDADADGRLAALVFVELDETDDAAHIGRGIALRNERGRGQVLLDVPLEDPVQDVVWRQRI